jgi:hypothetical protein
MNHFVESISDLVFIESRKLFTYADVILFHPGHFPELNEQLVEHIQKIEYGKVMIPSLYNRFLEANEYEYHKPILVNLGVQSEKILPITGDHKSVQDIVKSAFESLQNERVTNVLLAGKAFFCRRFLLLSSIYAPDHMKLDVLPLYDNRGIDKTAWFQTEKGVQRVMNEVKQYSKIIETYSTEMISPPAEG